MNDFLKMDIFFVVSTLAVVLLTAFLVAIFIRVLRILRSVDRVSETVADESEQIKKDIDDVRAGVKEGGMRIGHLLGIFGKPSKKRRTKKS